MFSPRDSDAVLDELGDKFTLALVTSTAAAREDLRAMREWRPGWFPRMFQREIAGIVHSRIWSGLQDELDGLPGFELTTREPYREVRIWKTLGRTYTLRIKRHREDDLISSYRTRSDIEFWGGAVATFEGMEEINLAAGYRWEAGTGTVGEPVISYREGKENVIWAVALDRGDEVGVPVRRTPIPPSLPQIDLVTGAEEDTQEGRE